MANETKTVATKLIQENSHVMVLAHPELTGVAHRVVGDRVYVGYDHESLDNLSAVQWANNAEEWYDVKELVAIHAPRPVKITNQQRRSIEIALGDIKIDNFNMYHEGFSFTTKTELDAYKAAYKYKGCKNVVVKEAPNVKAWLVQVYTAMNS